MTRPKRRQFRFNTDGAFFQARHSSPPPPFAPLSSLFPRTFETHTILNSVTHLAPLSLAQRDSIGTRMRSMFSVRVFGQVSVRDIVASLVYVLLHVVVGALAQPADVTAWADLFGHFAVGNSLAVAFPATRNSLIAVLTGVHFEHTIQYHRWIGRLLLALVVVHAVLYLPKCFNVGLGSQSCVAHLSAVGQGLENWYGLIATVACIVLFFTSLEYVRRRHFEVRRLLPRLSPCHLLTLCC